MTDPMHRASGPGRLTPQGFELPAGPYRLTAAAHASGCLAIAWQGPAPLAPSPAVLDADGLGPAPIALAPTPTGYRLTGPGWVLLIDTASAITLAWETPAGTPLWGPVSVGERDGKLVLAGTLAPDDAFYGLGEKPGYLDKRGRRYQMWNTDNTGPHVETQDTLYQSIPFLITRHGGRHAGFFFDDPGATAFDLGQEAPDAWRFEADGTGLRLYVVAGPDLAAVVTGYTALTGRMPLPPRWALGYHQSRWSYETADEVARIAGEFRARQIPADAIHLDIHYMDRYRVFTWSPSAFPDPAGLIKTLRARGLRAVTIIDPGVKVEPGYGPYDECLARDLYVREASGAPFVGEVWPGACLFPDFEREATRAWWGKGHQALLEAGVSGFWNDMNEPSVFRGPAVPRVDQTMPETARHGDRAAEIPHRWAHNLYGFQMSRATREGLLALAPDRRPFVISRAGYAGIQRHAMVWTGDNHSIWAHLEQGIPMVLNLGLSGVAFVGPDVGGFMGDCTPELLERWTQLGVFMPFFRNHSALGSRSQEPWAFGPATEAVCARAIALRYRLLPALYTAFWQAASTGLPIARPLVLSHPDDAEAPRLWDQFMVGDDLLVAPVTKPGASHRMVYFPAGRWFALDGRQPQQGPGYAVVGAARDHIPVFVREGAVVPMGPVRQHTGEPLPVLELAIYPGATLSGAWYDDDGESLAHAQGAYTHWRFGGTWDEGGLTLTIEAPHQGYDSPTRSFTLDLPGERIPTAVSWDGAPLAGWQGAGDVGALLRPGTLHVAF